MRKFTLIFALLIAGLWAFGQKPTVSKVWEHSLMSTADWSSGIPIGGIIPAWMGNMTERGMALYDGKLYIMSRKVTPPVIQVLDAETGNALSTIPVDTALVKGGTYAVNDIAITPGGKILFCNLSTNSHTQAFKLYLMEEKTGGGYTTKNILSWNSKDTIAGVAQPFKRLGDAFGFWGNISAEEDGYVLVGDANAAAPEPLVFRWDIKAGVVTQEPVVIKLKAVYPAPVGTAIPKLGITPRFWPMSKDQFWADGHSVYPTLYNMQGELLATFNGAKKFINPGISGVAFFSFKGKDFILGPATSHNNAAAPTAPKAAFELFQIPAGGPEMADSIAVFPQKGLGTNTNSSYASPICLDVLADKVLMYIMSPYNGIACYKLTMEGGAKKVGYFTKQKDMDPAAATVQTDPVLKMLQADPNLAVTLNVLSDVSTGATADISGYDVVVIQESLGGGDGILQPAGALALTKLTKPVVYNKTYAFRTGRALTAGGSATGAETPGIYKITVDAANQSKDLFKGLTFTNNEVELFVTGSADNGTVGSSIKALNYTTGLVISAANTLLAIPSGVTAGPTLCFNDIPAGTTVGGEVIPARMIAVGMNFGAMCANNGTNITIAGLTIWRNAVYSLAGLAVPTTPVSTGIRDIRANLPVYRLYPNPATERVFINVERPAQVGIYSMTGSLLKAQLVQSASDQIEIGDLPRGMYLVKSMGSNDFALKLIVR